MRRGQPGTDTQGVERLSGGIGIALQVRQLRPASVFLLFGNERLSKWGELLSRFPSPGKAEELIDALLVIIHAGGPEPFASAGNAFSKFRFASGERIMLQRVHSQCGGSNIAGLDRRAG